SQTTFYSIQSDSFSALWFGIAFVGLIKLLQTERPPLSLAICTGLALAATCLVKTTNLALFLVVGLAFIFKILDTSHGKLLGKACCVGGVGGRPDRGLVCLERSHVWRFDRYCLEN